MAPAVAAPASMIAIMWPRRSRREPRTICWAVENKVMSEAS